MKSRWRWVVLATLVVVPVMVLAGFGFVHLWSSGWWFWVWWPLSGSFALALFLGWRWQSQKRLLVVDPNPLMHWTERDNQAWQLVLARAEAGARLPVAQFTTLNFYTQVAQEMALELGRFYHPKGEDPVENLTVPEILTVIELASHDLAEMVDQYLPAGHLLSLKDWRRARQAADWYQTVSDVGWLIGSIFSPVNTGLRYLASQAGISKPWEKLQQNLLFWFYSAYVHRVGTYLIELNSGRLRVGARRYRELMGQTPPVMAPQGGPDLHSPPLTIIVLGQAKAGKSSLVNALLGERLAQTSVVKATEEITRYELGAPESSARLTILDTVGYANAGPRQDQKDRTLKAAQDADLLLLVLHARNPGRQADLEMLQAVNKFFADHPQKKRPPLLLVLTHIDLLSPSLEWTPPYNWREPVTPKEQQIAQAVAAAKASLQTDVLAIPVCTAADRLYGINEWLLPTITGLLDEAHGVALVRCLHAEADKAKIRRIFQQLLASGKAAASILLGNR